MEISAIEAAAVALFGLAVLCVICSTMATLIHIYFHLRFYLKPHVQRLIIRILFMVPIYGVSSCFALYYTSPSYILEALRDMYEAFVIYTFFILLLNLVGGEREILAQKPPPTNHLFLLNMILRKRLVNVGDPIQFLYIRRGILQFAMLKPMFTGITLILRQLNMYHEGVIAWSSGYLWVSALYNVSVSWSLYCLALFYVACNHMLLPHRPFRKFICIKAIIFFSFWQGVAISLLVKLGVIRTMDDGAHPNDNIASSLQNWLICIEMLPAAIGHWYSFSHNEYLEDASPYAARLPLYYAIRDAFSIKDVYLDWRHTVKGTTFSFDTFSPTEAILRRLGERQRSAWEEFFRKRCGIRRKFRSAAVVTARGYLEKANAKGSELVEERVKHIRKVHRSQFSSEVIAEPSSSSASAQPSSLNDHLHREFCDPLTSNSDINHYQEPEEVLIEEEEVYFHRAKDEVTQLEFEEDDQMDHMYRASMRVTPSEYGYPPIQLTTSPEELGRKVNHLWKGKQRMKPPDTRLQSALGVGGFDADDSDERTPLNLERAEGTDRQATSSTPKSALSREQKYTPYGATGFQGPVQKHPVHQTATGRRHSRTTGVKIQGTSHSNQVASWRGSGKSRGPGTSVEAKPLSGKARPRSTAQAPRDGAKDRPSEEPLATSLYGYE